MYKKIPTFIIAVTLLLPVIVFGEPKQRSRSRDFHKEQQEKRMEYLYQERKENRALRDSLQGMTKEEKKESLQQHGQEQFQEKRVFNQQMHDENMAFLKERLQNNKRLTEPQKEELINFFEQQYQENVHFRDQQHQENVEFFERIANDPEMTQEERKAAFKAYCNQQREESKEHRTLQKEERKDTLKTMKEEVRSKD